MSRRVQLDSAKGLRVSAPGFDAATATLDKLWFSPDYKMRRAVLTGAYLFDSEGWKTILYGESFPSRPFGKFAVMSNQWQNVDVSYGPTSLINGKILPVSPTSVVSNQIRNWSSVRVSHDRIYSNVFFSSTFVDIYCVSTLYYEISREV